MEGLRHGAAGVAGRGHEHGQPFDSRAVASGNGTLAQGHQPRQRARAKILEGERGPVKQLDHTQVVVELHDRDRENSARHESATRACRDRTHRRRARPPGQPQRPETVRPRWLCHHESGSRSIRDGTYSPPSGAMPASTASRSETAGAFPRVLTQIILRTDYTDYTDETAGRARDALAPQRGRAGAHRTRGGDQESRIA